MKRLALIAALALIVSCGDRNPGAEIPEDPAAPSQAPAQEAVASLQPMSSEEFMANMERVVGIVGNGTGSDWLELPMRDKQLLSAMVGSDIQDGDGVELSAEELRRLDAFFIQCMDDRARGAPSSGGQRLNDACVTEASQPNAVWRNP